MRHSLNIIVAMLSMAAGAWQGTTAQTDQPASPARQEQSRKTPAQVTLVGCVLKGLLPGTFLLTTASAVAQISLEPASAPAARPQDGDAMADEGETPAPRTVSYELIADKPDVNLAAAVGTRVEAQGAPERTARGATVEDGPAAASAAADSPASTSPAGTSGQLSQRSRVRVTAIRPLGGPCE